MAAGTRFFSNHFNPTAGDVGTTAAIEGVVVLPTRPHMIDAGIGGARLRHKVAYIKLGTDFDDTNEARIMGFKSGDRIHSIKLTHDNAGTTGNLDIGLHLAGNAHDGAVVDDDLFAVNYDPFTAAADRVEILGISGGLNDFDRGKSLWEMLGLDANPFLEYELSFTGETGNIDAAKEFLVEVEYTAGD